MKRKIIATTLPFLFLMTNASYAAPIDLFIEDYETINQTIYQKTVTPFVAGMSIDVEGEAKSENIADFDAKTVIVFNNENDFLESEEQGEVVFTNYAENKGVATIISKSEMQLYSKGTVENKLLMDVQNIATQSQIDRENLVFKSSSQVPEMILTNPDALKQGEIRVKDFATNDLYIFENNFSNLQGVKLQVNSGEVSIDINDGTNLAKIDAEKGSFVTETDPQKKSQKSVLVIDNIAAITGKHGVENVKVAADQFTYETGFSEENGSQINGTIDIKNIVITSLMNDAQKGLLGDIHFATNIAPLVTNLYEVANQNSSITDYNVLDTGNLNTIALLKDYFIEGTAINITVNGVLGDSKTDNVISVTPKLTLIDKLAEADLTEQGNPADDLFGDLTFFEFVEQYIDKIELNLFAEKAYIVEFGSNIMFIGGDAISLDQARKEMNDFYEQFQLMAMILGADAPIVEFVGGGAKVQIQYANGVWMVNGKALDLKEIAALFS